MLSDLQLQGDYRSGRDALLNAFYIPCLQESSTYDRAVGYFSSSLMHVVAIAYSDFALRGGRFRLLCSPALSPGDFDAMRSAYERSETTRQAVHSQLREMLENPTTLPPTKLLATLIGAGIMEVRIAFSVQPNGIFHDKLGVFRDSDGRRVTFVGSANETFAAWYLNHESFEVFCSWRGERELLRTRNHARYFDSLWEGHEPGVRVEKLDSVTREQLASVAYSSVERAIEEVRRAPQGRVRPGKELLPHQVAVIESWRRAGHRGIVNFATGAGKTLVAIEGIKEWTTSGRPALVLVPGRDLHRQWVGELEHEAPGLNLLLAGAGHTRGDWERLLPSFGRPSATATPHAIISTMATFATDDFQARLARSRALLLVVDEMHRAGSPRVLEALERTPVSATMGLSATYSREWDELGTRRLQAVLGPVLEPVIGLAEAIALGLLVPYDYRLHTVTLSRDELARYEELTERIRRLMMGSSESSPIIDHVKLLALQRARILKQAQSKVLASTDILKSEYRDGDRWLVYCDSQAQLGQVLDGCEAEGLPAMEYHSAMVGDRGSVLSSLGRFGGIAVAIRCLDEGVDIPVCDNALILASSTVEREYVQRRGRILRRAPGKSSATVHDLLVVDEAGGALTRGEAKRALDFARLARNPGARARVQMLLTLSRDVEGLDYQLLEDGPPEDDLVE